MIQKKNTGKELVAEAKKCRIIPEDKIWVVYDKDGYTKHPETFSNAKDAGIKIAFSAISFETWILMHYEYTAKAFDRSEDIIKYLSGKNYLDYKKGDKTIYEQTKSLIETAITNSNRLRKSQIESNPRNFKIYNLNPYTDIDLVIIDIREMEELEKSI